MVTEGRRHERRTADRLIDWAQQGITYIFDRGYFCLCTLIAYCLAQAAVFGSTQRLTLAEAIQMLQSLSVPPMEAIGKALGHSAPCSSAAVPPAASESIIVALLLTQ